MYVSCPDCGKRFIAQPNWGEYELLVSRLSGGIVEPKGKNGHDVTDSSGICYQVKMSNMYKGGTWKWFGRFPNAGADIYVLFRITNDGKEHMYIMRDSDWLLLGKVDRKSDFRLVINMRNLYKISCFECEIENVCPSPKFRTMVDSLLGNNDARPFQYMF